MLSVTALRRAPTSSSPALRATLHETALAPRLVVAPLARRALTTGSPAKFSGREDGRGGENAAPAPPRTLRETFQLAAQQAAAQQQQAAASRNPSSPHYRPSLPPPIGFAIVPQQLAYVVERFGKFQQVLEPGLHFTIPFIDRVAYVHSLKEEAIPIQSQQAITRDNVTIQIDAVLYVRCVDAYAASYGVADPLFAMSQLAQTSMRSELGKMTLDKTFEEREHLNARIVEVINQAAETWGMKCLRYEIRDISPPVSVRAAMDSQAEAERKKRASVLQSEGDRQADMNRAEGDKAAMIMRAEAEAQAILVVARATADGLMAVARAAQSEGGHEAASLRVAEKYVDAFSKLAQKGNSVVVPANVSDVGGMVAQAMGIYGGLVKKDGSNPASGASLLSSDVPSVRDPPH